MDERAVLAPALSGRYEIEREIGRGGMATVYLARDLKHDRRVAIKVLHADLGAVLGVARFLSEIRVTANLQHPNVLPLFDSGEAAGLLYYVMPFVSGESLRAMLDREKQLPVDEAVRIATAMANALEYAHAHGVVHRDLKPENILLQSGQPIVADFGIALAVSNAGGARLTQTGMSLGTPQYMSPEQAAGDRIIDARSDVFALGAMTYEMLVGEPPHTGSTSQAIIARILTERPRSVRESRPSVSESIDFAIGMALEKLPADRFASAKEFADALQERGVSGPVRSAAPRAAPQTRVAFAAVAVVSLAALVASVGWWRSAHAPAPPVNRFVINVPPGVSVGGGGGLKVAMSHDGQSLAFASSDNRVFVRRLDQVEPIWFSRVRAPGPEFHFSVDGKWLAYWDRGVMKIPIGPGDANADATSLVTLPFRGAIAYFGADLIYLERNEFFSVPSGGGTPRKLASMDTARDRQWLRPLVLSDGKTIAFVVTPRRPGPSQLAVMPIDGGARTLLELETTGVVGYVDGILVFTRGGRLLAVKFDVGRRRVVGEPMDLTADRVTDEHGVTVSDNGTLAYLADPPPLARLELVDAVGNITAESPETREYSEPVVAPDGKHIAVTIVDLNQPDIYVYSVESRVLTRLTQTGAHAPAWTPDGKRIVFRSKAGIFSKPVDGGTAQEPIPGTSDLPIATEVEISRDGKYAVVLGDGRPGEPPTASQVTAIPLAGGEPLRIMWGAEAPKAFDVSPNSKWIAYESRETRQHEVYIHSFPNGAANLQVSTDGGDAPRWSADGTKLVYRNDKQFREVTFDFSGSVPRVVHTDTLFARRDPSARPIDDYSVHPDGKHFVVTRPIGEATKLVVVPNWISEVRSKLAGK